MEIGISNQLGSGMMMDEYEDWDSNWDENSHKESSVHFALSGAST